MKEWEQLSQSWESTQFQLIDVADIKDQVLQYENVLY